ENQEFVVFQLDQQGTFAYISPAIEHSAGYKVEECIGQPFWRFIYPEDLPEVQIRFQYSIAGKPGYAEFRALHKNGSVIWIRASSRPRSEEHKGVIGIMTDITERKRVEQALRESEDRYRDLAENSQDLMCVHDLRGNLLWVNPAPARSLGYTVEELL